MIRPLAIPISCDGLHCDPTVIYYPVTEPVEPLGLYPQLRQWVAAQGWVVRHEAGQCREYCCETCADDVSLAQRLQHPGTWPIVHHPNPPTAE